MTLDEAFNLVANLDYKETHRRFAPQHGLLQFNRHGEVVSVRRFKYTPGEKEQHEALTEFPGCLQISTAPHWFGCPADLQRRISEGLGLFAHMKRK